MKLFSTKYIVIFFILLAIGNAYIFLQGVSMGDKIAYFETNIQTLHQDNLDLQQQIFEKESLNYTASLAAQLDFTQKSTPVYLDNVTYALNR